MTTVFKPGAVLPFKIKRFPPPGVGNRGDTDTNGANGGGDFDRRNGQMSESPWVCPCDSH